ncbi:MAG: CRISPR-associated endonuclease Cas1 [Methanotrichaceae archaeon]|nr:CRISPR-associated endonuclease Cas1 [Methanotrichaceae archaeon]
MLNEFAYCPRLCYLEWIDAEFVDNADTVDGRFQHRQVDANADPVPEEEAVHARSVFLTGEKVGLTCRIDLLEGDGKKVTPVDYKRGEAPDIPVGAYEPDRVQLCAQGLVLRENGFDCQEGSIYFVRSKKRVPVVFDKALVKRTRELISDLRKVAEKRQIPPPLEESPKCNRCSLAGICLPDEVNLLKEMESKREPKGIIRRLLPARDDATPVYVVGQGHSIRKKGDRLEIWSKGGKTSEARLREISQLNLYGNVEITTPAAVDLMQRGVPVLHFSHGGWFRGISAGHTHKNVELRIRQFQWAADRKKSLSIARLLISGKIKNCRTQVRRNDPEQSAKALETLEKLSKDARNASSIEKLLGIEGAAAEAYFARLDSLLKSDQGFTFQNRNRRPPKDPVNAVLSYLYAILAKEMFVTLLAVGFDPYLGFYHQPRYGRPALALDMMEEFRPIIADATAITLFNKGELSEKDFIKTGIGVSLTPKAKKKVIGGYERSIGAEITHPLFGYTVSYRRILEVQARLLSRILTGEIREYPAFLRR